MEEQTNETNENSFIPALQESERFIKFLLGKFDIEINEGWVITINKTSPSTIGYFKSKDCEDNFVNTTQDLNNINLNTLFLKTHSPYECLAHELAHFINFSLKINDCSSNQYHNKHFKNTAEKLLLNVEKTNKGFNKTSESDEFKKMLEEEFKPVENVFSICQNPKKKGKVGSRLVLFECDCGFKVRCARTDKTGREFKGLCLYCNSEFKEVEK